MVRALRMELIKGYLNDYVVLESFCYEGSSVQIAELAIQATGISTGTIVRLKPAATKLPEAIDFARCNHSTYSVFSFNSLINEVGLSQHALTLKNNHYCFLLAYDKYDVLSDKIIGEGAFGTVKSAINIQCDLVAIKQFKLEEHWEQELANGGKLSKLNKPQGIVLPIDYGNTDNQYSIVYPQGVATSYKIAALNVEQLVIGIQQLISALSWLHSNDLFHGDIKLDNIIFAQNGLAFIDFGVITNQLTWVYNATYCCPDMGTNTIDFKIEVMALGVVMFRMFSIHGLSQKGVPIARINELTSLSYQPKKDENPNDWQPPKNWRSPYAASFDELALLEQGIYARTFLPTQRKVLNELFLLIKDMLLLNSQHRPSSNEILKRINQIQGNIS